jgi:acyl-coenzyme A thioesterase PaaI-like protein
MKKTALLKIINLWPPYLGAGVRVTKIAPDIRSIDVEMKLRFWNQNYVGTHFGGSLFSMTDPFLMLILLENLGKDYVVWDKSGSIRFRKPGKGTVRAHFQLSKEEIDSIRSKADTDPKVEPQFTVNILDETGSVVAEVQRVLHVRRKDRSKENSVMGAQPETEN